MTQEEFKSFISRFGPILTPYHLTITDEFVMFKRNMGIGSLYLSNFKIYFKRKKITNVTLIDNILWFEVLISCSSGEKVHLKHFKKIDAERIRNLLVI